MQLPAYLFIQITTVLSYGNKRLLGRIKIIRIGSYGNGIGLVVPSVTVGGGVSEIIATNTSHNIDQYEIQVSLLLLHTSSD